MGSVNVRQNLNIDVVLSYFPDAKASPGELVAVPVRKHTHESVFLVECERNGYTIETTRADITRLEELYNQGHKVPIVMNARANWFFVRDHEGMLRPVGVFVDGPKKAWEVRLYRAKSKGGLSLGSHVILVKKK